MKSKTKVDVIIPTYNGLPWLKVAAESVLSQTHNDLELYIVDDGSTDKTEFYVKSLKDKRVHYIRKENGGQSTARNLGIQKSNSPFVAFLDADDIWYNEKLEKQIKIMSDAGVGLVYGHHHIIDEFEAIKGKLLAEKRGRIFNDLCGGNFIAGSASMVLVRRSVFDKIGLFKEDFLIGEDWEMWLRIANEYEVDFVPEYIAALRQHSDGMQQDQVKMADGLVYMLEVMKKEFDLSKVQKRAMSSYCLYNAAVGYNLAHKRSKARKTILKLFINNPRQVLLINHWKIHIGFGIYTRVIFGNPLFDILLLVYKKISRFIKFLIKFPFRTARIIYVKFKDSK